MERDPDVAVCVGGRSAETHGELHRAGHPMEAEFCTHVIDHMAVVVVGNIAHGSVLRNTSTRLRFAAAWR